MNLLVFFTKNHFQYFGYIGLGFVVTVRVLDVDYKLSIFAGIFGLYGPYILGYAYIFYRNRPI